MKHIKLLFLLLLVSGFGFAQTTLSEWVLTADGSPSNVDANITASLFTSTGGTISYAANGAFRNGWSVGAIDLNEYFEISITPNSGFNILLEEVLFSERRSGTGIRDYQVRYSKDAAFTTFTTIATVNVPDNTSERNGDVTGLSETINDGETLYVRFYGYNAEAGGGTWRINDNSLALRGSVSASCPNNLDFANIQFPTTTQTITQGATTNVVYAQVYEPGLTDTPFAQGAGVTAEIGYSTTDTDPSTWTNWLPASYNNIGGNNDEYFAEVGSTLTPGTYYIASRFQLNSCPFIYGGTAGVWSTGNSLQLIVNADQVDFCNVDFPKNGNINIGDNFNVYAQAYEPGVTDAAGQGANILAWIGYNSADVSPISGTGWTWIAATYDSDFGNNDQYTAEIGSGLAAGTYYFASRFQLNGSSFSYGGIQADNVGNFWDPTTNNNGILNITNPCSSIFSDDFSAGLTQWNNTADWTTTAGELKHNITGTAGDSYINADIGIQNLAYGDYEWSFCMRNGNWDPSSNNNFSFILLSSQSNLFSNATGYRVGVNQTTSDDLLKIYRVNNGADTEILASAFNWNANDDVCIRVTRSSAGDWELFYDDGTGEVSAGTTNDTTYTTGSFIGSYFEFSSTRAGELWIDDVNVCSNPVSCTSTVTWDGTSWSPTTPSASTHAVLSANYNTSTAGLGSFTACTLTIGSGINLTVAPNDYVEVFTDVTNNGRISVQNQGSFVQVDNAATYDDSGSTFFATNDAAIVDRETSFLSEWYEYTYWSSPVANETFGNALFQSSQFRRFEFNAGNFVDSQYETLNDNTLVAGAGVDDIDDNGDDWFLKASGDNMVPGVGYAATHSIGAFIFGPNNYVYTFRGTLNNGDITVPVERNDTETGDINWNLIGNPYPSAIDADLFFAQNNFLSNPTSGKLDGAIYLWSQSTPPSSTTNGNEPLNFTTNDYAIINGTGETVGGDGITPNRYIPSGQGFFVTYSDTPGATSGTVTFNNAMRVTGNNDQFFRAGNNTAINQHDKLWLNITTDNGLFNQTVIGYVPGATAANDGAYYDAKKNGAILASLSLYTLVPGDSKKLAIQGKAPSDLNLNETITLGFLNSVDVPTIYTISIDHLQGDFLSNNAIYLKDNLLNTYQDLTTGDYSFTSAIGEFNNRFEIVFTQPSLSIDDVSLTENNLLIVEGENDNVSFKLTNEKLTIKSIKIYDALGRLLHNLKGNKSTETYNLSNLSQATYIAKVELSNGQILSKKAIKK
ncbi:T9SS type A sorting domain-containing protein [Olleya sp. YS]|uniref:T9SS type A sorting domain-containing protein n=1 Tax=Olleya sp. YS TaxID=3028318 RepID=UPI0024340EB2|nr:T9SS type A sorting domain-containing protein [Olleya sp. YS]WGD35981.1 T9SS type A sorting domain-containing protein [Olleya sp. YS]